MEQSVTRALKKIYTGSYDGEFPRELWEITVNKLNEAVDLEFGKQYKPLASQLKYQNGVFAAFKSKNQTQTLENLKAASKAATFSDFAEEVRGTVKDYNYNHLKAEWNTAKKASRSAKRWAKALEDADLFPNIKYLASTAKEPRDKHKPFYGLVFAMDDPKLDSILPPSDWGCQCGWTTTDEELTIIPKRLPEPEPGLDNNPGKDGALFSTSHPHIKAGSKDAGAIIKSNIAAVYNIDEKDITEFYFNKKTNGCVFSVADVRKESEFAENFRIGKMLADKGNLIELIAPFENSSKERIPTADAIMNGTFIEFKTTGSTSVKRLRKHIYDASQSKGRAHGDPIDLLIEFNTDIDDDIIRDAFNRSKGAGETTYINGVYFVKGNRLTKRFSVDDIINGALKSQ